MKINRENEKQYLTWYYENLRSISIVQSIFTWTIFLLLVFSIFLDKQTSDFIKILLVNLDLDLRTIQIFIPIILSIIFWEYLESMRAISIAVKNIQELNLLKND